jgi:hypothetical protein
MAAPLLRRQFSGPAQLDSHYKRLQRFLRGFDCLGDGCLTRLASRLKRREAPVGLKPSLSPNAAPASAYSPRFCPVRMGAPHLTGKAKYAPLRIQVLRDEPTFLLEGASAHGQVLFNLAVSNPPRALEDVQAVTNASGCISNKDPASVARGGA